MNIITHQTFNSDSICLRWLQPADFLRQHLKKSVNDKQVSLEKRKEQLGPFGLLLSIKDAPKCTYLLNLDKIEFTQEPA